MASGSSCFCLMQVRESNSYLLLRSPRAIFSCFVPTLFFAKDSYTSPVKMRSAIAISLFAAGAFAAPLEERQAARGKFTFYPIPTPLSGICDLAEGHDKAIWFEDILVNRIGRLDPNTGVVTDYPIPFTTPASNVSLGPIPDPGQQLFDRTAFSCAIRPGADGYLYATNGVRNQLVQINEKTKEIKVFGPVDPTGNLFPFNDVYSADNGLYLTQTTGNTFEFFSFKDHTFTTYHVPTPLALPLGVYVASDKKVYIPELVGNKILVGAIVLQQSSNSFH